MIEIRIVGEEKTELALKSFGLGVKDRLRTAITGRAIFLTRYVKERKLSGQVLKNRSGTLRRKINYRISETPTGVSASVGGQLSYLPPHEYGFDGIVSVKAHLRTVTMAFGRPIAPVTAAVREHPMHMRIPERSFLRSSLRENAASIRETLAAAVLGPIS